MKVAARVRNPVDGSVGLFESESDARLYLEIALTHWMSFTEIYRMVMAALYGPEAPNENFDLDKEFRLATEEGKQDAELLANFDLPPAELLQIWMRSRRALQRLAEFSPFSPTRRERIKAFLQESEAEMLAMLERHEQRASDGD